MKSRLCAYGDKSVIRYIISGFFNTGLSFVIYVTAIQTGVHYTIANFIAWVISVVMAFLLTSLYVFRKPLEYKRFPPFVLSNMVSLVLSTAMLFVLIRIFSVNPIAASVIVIPVVVAVNFYAAKYLVFR